LTSTYFPSSEFSIETSARPTSDSDREKILSKPGFGKYFTDHMVVIDWTLDKGWHAPRIIPYGPLMLDPASLVLHYAQAIFEGLKAYQHADGSIWAFRAELNAARFSKSAERLGLPELPKELFIQSIQQLVCTDAKWLSQTPETSLYLRPFMVATESFLGVRSAEKVSYYVIASPAGPYFENGVSSVPIWVSAHHTRAAKGGTGFAKCAGNYAGSLAPLQEARQNGCAQVLFLDAQHGQYLEELGGMNIFIVFKDGSLATPALSDSILAGVTRQSIIEIARTDGRRVDERQISLEEVREGLANGDIAELFACGTAAVLFPISILKSHTFTYVSPDAGASNVSLSLREKLTDIQYGRSKNSNNWMQKLSSAGLVIGI
jgi:branched-chain amino acid aminotransferase